TPAGSPAALQGPRRVGGEKGPHAGRRGIRQGGGRGGGARRGGRDLRVRQPAVGEGAGADVPVARRGGGRGGVCGRRDRAFFLTSAAGDFYDPTSRRTSGGRCSDETMASVRPRLRGGDCAGGHRPPFALRREARRAGLPDRPGGPDRRQGELLWRR